MVGLSSGFVSPRPLPHWLLERPGPRPHCPVCENGRVSVGRLRDTRVVVRAANGTPDDELLFDGRELDLGSLELDLGDEDSQGPVQTPEVVQEGKLSAWDDQKAFETALDGAWSSLESVDFAAQETPTRTRRQKKTPAASGKAAARTPKKSSADQTDAADTTPDPQVPDSDQVAIAEDDYEMSLDDDDDSNEYETVEDTPKWYFLIIRTLMEDTVRIALENMLRNVPSLRSKLLDVLLPVKKLRKYNKAGRRMDRNDKVFPGYLLLNAQLDEELYNALKGITHVQGFVADPNYEKKKKDPWRRPEPLSAAEVKRIFAAIEENEAAEPPRELSFNVGDLVTITSGPFKGSSGNIKALDRNGKVTVGMVVFGKETDVDLEFNQVTSPNFM